MCVEISDVILYTNILHRFSCVSRLANISCYFGFRSLQFPAHVRNQVFFTASMLTGVPGLGMEERRRAMWESDSPLRLASVEIFMEDFMILNIIHFADMARRVKDGVS